MKRIAIFASGEGTNAERIIDHFNGGNLARVVLVISNSPKAGVLERAVKKQVPMMILDRKEFFSDQAIIKYLLSEVDLIVLAGFLWMVPAELIRAFPDRIINIHPALLPKYGGKGMFGSNVHKAVINDKEKESGISIHYVNEKFDEGEIIFQSRCKVDTDDTPETLSKKVQQLEHQHYTEVIEKLLSK